MIAAWLLAANRPLLYRKKSLRKIRWLVVVVVLLGCPLVVYAYVWRQYLALVLTPSSSFDHVKYYREQYENADAATVATLRQELTRKLPEWLAQYAHWHAKARRDIMIATTTTNCTTTPRRILLISIESSHAGGLADRLRSLPFLLWEAARTQRVFLMQWKKPCALQEFLLPPLGGIDWTVPEGLTAAAVLDDSDAAVWYIYDQHDNMQLVDNNASFQEIPVIKTMHGPWTFEQGMPLLAKALNVSSWSAPIFSHVYRLLLTPSPPVQQLLDRTMQNLGLEPQKYDAVHLRARYPGIIVSDDSSSSFQRKSSLFSRSVDADGFRWTANARKEVLRLATRAIDCLASLHHDTSSGNEDDDDDTTRPEDDRPIYFCSDTNEAVKLMTTTTTIKQEERHVVGMVTPHEKLHLDRNDRVGLVRKTSPVSFYPAFVDLWILSRARCLAVGAGGYGVFASILGETSCLLFYSKNSFVESHDEMMCK